MPEESSVSRRGIHRVTADSYAGRRMTQAKGARIATDAGISPDVLEHNRRLDQERAAKLAARKARRGKT